MAIYGKDKFDEETKKKSKDNIENLFKLKEITSGKQKEDLKKIEDILDSSRTKDFGIECEKFLKLYVKEMLKIMGFAKFFNIYLKNLENSLELKNEKNLAKSVFLTHSFANFNQNLPSLDSEKEKEMFEKIVKYFAKMESKIDLFMSENIAKEEENTLYMIKENTSSIIKRKIIKIKAIFEDYVREQSSTIKEPVLKLGSKSLDLKSTLSQVTEQAFPELSNPKSNLFQATENTSLRQVKAPVLVEGKSKEKPILRKFVD